MYKLFGGRLIATVTTVCLLAGCAPAAAQEEGTSAVAPETVAVAIPDEAAPLAAAPGTLEGGGVTVDVSGTAKGLIKIKYAGKNSKIKVQISKGKTVYTYNINARGQFELFPLTEGSGSYSVAVFENISGAQYAQVFGKSIDVKLENEFIPFLQSNQYVNFSSNSAAVKTAAGLAGKAATEKDLVASVYEYVIANVSYDDAKAASVQSGYLPDVDKTLSSKKGICFDYAALMSAMLRSQDIPTKLVVGYAGDIYHAWISVYLKDVGWVDDVIFFDGKSWKLMDPTFASSGKNDPSVKQYIGNGSNYRTKYTY